MHQVSNVLRMKNKVSKFIKYPLYPTPLTWLEKLIIKLHVGCIVKCSVCGTFSLIYVEGENLRETCICIKCRSKNRHGQIAYVASHIVGRAKKRCISSLKDFTKLDDFVVYNTKSRGPIHEWLSKMKNYVCSEYFGYSYKSGDFVNNIMHQDLMDMSLNTESVDLVISSDVFEHIPDPYKAHEEVYRVLKRGGRHIFTVPFYQTEFIDEDRTITDSNGNTVFLKEPIYHGDPIRPEGALVYKIFSLEMLIKLRRIGFMPNLYHLYKPLCGIFGQNAIVFEAIKNE